MINALTLDSILTEAQKALISQGTKIRFRLPLTAQQVSEQLTIAFAGGVAYRGGAYLNDPNTIAKIEKVSSWLSSSTMKPMLLLCGSKGTGKTEMARSIDRLIFSLGEKARQLERDEGSYVTTRQENKKMAALFTQLAMLPKPMMISAQRLASLAKEDNPEYDKAVCAKFLIVDDLGAEPSFVKVFGSEKYPLVDLITERYDKLCPTVFTTNLQPDQISSYYGERISDRLMEVGEFIFYKGDSFRTKQAKVK